MRDAGNQITESHGRKKAKIYTQIHKFKSSRERVVDGNEGREGIDVVAGESKTGEAVSKQFAS